MVLRDAAIYATISSMKIQFNEKLKNDANKRARKWYAQFIRANVTQEEFASRKGISRQGVMKVVNRGKALVEAENA